MFNFADDFLLLARSKTELDEKVGKLSDAVANLPGGRFNIRMISKGSASKGFRYLGHTLIIREGKAIAKLHEGAIAKLLSRLDEISKRSLLVGVHMSISQKGRLLRLLARELEFIRGWARAYGECVDVVRYSSFFLATCKDHAKGFGLSMDMIIAASDESMKTSYFDHVPSG